MSAPDLDQFARGDAAVAVGKAHARSLYRRAHEILALAKIAQDCATEGRTFDLDRAERKLARIAAIAGGVAQ